MDMTLTRLVIVNRHHYVTVEIHERTDDDGHPTYTAECLIPGCPAEFAPEDTVRDAIETGQLHVIHCHDGYTTT